MHIQIYDTTLRDGTQREGISLSCEDKVKIARKLDDLGVEFIEGGWPGSNPKDAEFFQRVQGMKFKNATVTAFGSTCRVGGDPADDPNIGALLDSHTSVCTVVGKTSMLHVTEVLRTAPAENLRLIEQSIAHLVEQGRRVIYDAEHFFDGYKLDKIYALETLRAAARGGAEMVVLCDTNGGAMPWEIAHMVRAVKRDRGGLLGIHTHNDGECAVANSLAAVREGCVQVQGTINGYGDLSEGGLKRLTEVAHFVAEVANLSPDEHLAYVGKSAFAHKGGIHVAAVRRNLDSYQHIDPKLVGNEMRVVVSELSGRGNLLSKAEEYGLDMDGSADVTQVLNEIKALEAQGFSFEAAEASVAMMMKRQRAGYAPPFQLVDFSVTVEHRMGSGTFAEATVKVKVDGEIIHTVAEGNGPVNALDAALRKALTPVFPVLGRFQLADYKVRILDGENGTAALTRVLIDTQNGTKRWSTVGASTNIIEASWRALADSVEYGLMTA
ncbi:MAG: citramalate synthase [Chloroflexi bacterium]|nr:citramalate synthase [Chloroflexota bacterium]